MKRTPEPRPTLITRTCFSFLSDFYYFLCVFDPPTIDRVARIQRIRKVQTIVGRGC